MEGLVVPVAMELLSAAAQAEAESLGLVDSAKEASAGGAFEPWFDQVEENFRALSVAECAAVFLRYRGEAAGDLDRFRECNAVYAFDEAIEARCRAELPALAPGRLRRRVEIFLETLLQFRVAGDAETADHQAELEGAFMAYRGEVGGESRSFGQLNQLVKGHADRSFREAAWKAFIPMGEANRENFLRLVEARNRQARGLGYRDFVDMRWKLSSIDESWLLNLLDRLENLTDAPYKALSSALATRMGVESLGPWDTAFAIDGLCPAAQEAFDEAGAKARLDKLVGGWGFDLDALDIPTYACESFTMGGLCFGIEPGKTVKILLSPASGPRYHRSLFHEFGHALHFRLAGQGSILLNVEDMAFNEGMAVILESVVGDPAWVQANLKLEGEALEAYATYAKANILAWMRTLIANVRFEHALYARTDENPDEIYLDLQNRLGGYQLPAEVGTRWASDQMLVSLPVNWHNYLIAELIARQSREHLAKQGPLYDNPAVGTFLREAFYLPGASRPWLDKVASATGSELSPEPFLRFLSS